MRPAPAVFTSAVTSNRACSNRPSVSFSLFQIELAAKQRLRSPHRDAINIVPMPDKVGIESQEVDPWTLKGTSAIPTSARPLPR